MPKLAAVMLAGAMLAGCSADTNIAVTHPPQAGCKTVTVTVSGRWPADSPESVRARACKAVLAECHKDACITPKWRNEAGTVLKIVDRLPKHSFTWSGTCGPAIADCSRANGEN